MKHSTIKIFSVSLIGLTSCALTEDTLNGYFSHKRLFVSTGTGFFPSVGISGADEHCANNSARPPSQTGKFKALIVGGTTRRACLTANCGGSNEGIDWVLAPNTTYYDRSGVNAVFTTNDNGIFSLNTLKNPIDTTKRFYWTGLQVDWRTSGFTCAGWSDTSCGSSGLKGYPLNTDSGLISIGNSSCCAQDLGLACVEQ